MDLLLRAGGAAILGALIASPAASTVGDEAQPACYDAPGKACPLHIESMPVADALLAFAKQGGLSVLFLSDDLAHKTSPLLSGSYTADAALTRLLAGTGFTHFYLDEHTVGLRPLAAANDKAAPGTENGDQRPEAEKRAYADARPADRTPHALPEVTVRSHRTLNMEPEKSEDDIQPYIVLTRGEIERSPGRNAFDAVTREVTASVAAVAPPQQGAVVNADSLIDLRGLGVGGTLVLVDGRRLPASNLGGTELQSDLKAIPLSLIERIEVLPVSASVFYGGDAVGGVVNAVLKRDFVGTEASFQFDTPSDGVASARSMHLSHGARSNDGVTHFQVFGSYSKIDGLRQGDRPFLLAGRRWVLEHDPLHYPQSPGVPLGAAGNVKGLERPLFDGNPAFITHLTPGYISSMGLQPLQANAGSYNLDLADTAQLGGGAGANLVNEVERYSADAMLFQELSSTVTFFFNMAGAWRRSRAPINSWQYGGVNNAVIAADAPNNPFGQTILVTVPMHGGGGEFSSDMHTYRAIAGITQELGKDGKFTLDVTRARTSLALAAPEVVDLAEEIRTGRLDILRDTAQHPLDITPWLRDWRTRPFLGDTLDFAARFTGPLAQWSAGPAKLNLALQHRKEHYSGGIQERTNGAGTAFTAISTPIEQTMSVGSARADVTAPLRLGTDALGRFRELELQLAVSRDAYEIEVTPSASVPDLAQSPESFEASFGEWAWSFGVRYRFNDSVAMRASHGTGFGQPAMNELIRGPERSFAGPTGLVDERRAGEPIENIMVTAGGNPALHPETLTSTTFGIVFTPTFLPGVRLSVDGTYVDKRHNILDLSELAFENLRQYELLCPDCITRAPASPGDPFGIGPITSIAAGFVNAARLRSLAFDGLLAVTRDLERFGRLDLRTKATWTRTLDLQLTDDTPVQELVGLTARRPLELRGHAALKWSLGRWAVDWDAQYFDSYRVPEFTVRRQGAGKVPSQHFHDVHVSFLARDWWQAGSETELRFGVRNVLNARPHVDTGEEPLYSPVGDPWLRSYSVSVRRLF